MGFRLLILIALFAASLLFQSPLFAQASGNYLGGTTGLDNGEILPPGFSATFSPYVNHIESLKDRHGHTLLHIHENVAVYNYVFSMTFNRNVLGGLYGFNFAIPAADTRIVQDEFNASQDSAGLGDLYFAPLLLGWTKGNADFAVDYGFYIPSGDFDPALTLNPGLGFWEHQIQVGTNYSIGKRQLWNTSLLTTWEISQRKISQDLKPGPMFTGEYSLGRRFNRRTMNAGVAGFIYHKLAPDSGSAVDPLEASVLDRQFGIGPDWKYTNLKWRLDFNVRYEAQFGVRAKTSGPLLVIGITYLKLAHSP